MTRAMAWTVTEDKNVTVDHQGVDEAELSMHYFVTDVKQELRKASALKVLYSANSRERTN